MDLILLVLVICIIGFAVWLFTTKIPMPPMWAQTIQIVTLIVLVLYLINRFMPLPNVLGH